MKDLILAIQGQLKAQIAYLKAVPIVPDENVLFDTTPFPCVAIKDGPVVPELFGGQDGYTCTVIVVPYVEINSLDGMIIGKSGLPGILDVSEDVKTALIRWAPDGYSFLNLAKEDESRMMAGPDRPAVQQKKLAFQWVKG